MKDIAAVVSVIEVVKLYCYSNKIHKFGKKSKIQTSKTTVQKIMLCQSTYTFRNVLQYVAVVKIDSIVLFYDLLLGGVGVSVVKDNIITLYSKC